MDIDSAFETIANAMVAAGAARRVAVAEMAAESVGLIKLGDGTPSQISAWEKTFGEKTLRFQWRWYDPSQAFSIRPDINILTVEIKSGDQVARRAEERFED